MQIIVLSLEINYYSGQERYKFNLPETQEMGVVLSYRFIVIFTTTHPLQVPVLKQYQNIFPYNPGLTLGF
mgnify:CR=1 FL=1